MGWVIVGLGNPGEEYTGTRHNTGRMAVTAFAKNAGFREFLCEERSKSCTSSGLVGKTAVALVLPDTFMNKSGVAVSKFVKSAKAAERLVVVYDDLDLPLGSMKISYDRSSGGHRGLESIIRALKTQKFTRVRIGISPQSAAGTLRKPQGEKEVNDFILSKYKPHELAELKTVFKRAAAALDATVRHGREIAMNEFNR